MKKKIFIMTFIIIIAFLFMGGAVKVNADSEIIESLTFYNKEVDLKLPIISDWVPSFQLDSEQSSYVTDYSFDMYYKENEEYFKVKTELDFKGGKTYYLRGEFTLSEDITITDNTRICWGTDEYLLAELKEQSQVIIEGKTYTFNIPYTLSVPTPIDVLEVNIEKPTEGPVPDYMNNASFNYDGVELELANLVGYNSDSANYDKVVESLEYGDKYEMLIGILIFNKDYILDKNSKIELWGNLYDVYDPVEEAEQMVEMNEYYEEIQANGGIIAGLEGGGPRALLIYVSDTVVEEYNINVIVDNLEQGTVTGSNLRYIKGEEDRTLTITPNAGYILDKVLINNIDKTADVIDNQLTISNITEDKEVKVFFKKIPYTLTINNTEGATITPNGVIIVESGDNQEITIIAESGYILKSVKVNGVEKLSNLTDNKLELTNITEDTEVTVVVEKIIYKILEGKDLKTSDLSKLRFRIDADYSKFSTGGKVFVDDIELNNTQYTSKSGSTIIELAESFASTLSEGNHKIKVVFNDGAEVATNFTIESANVPSGQDEKQDGKEDKKEEVANPKTGDNIAKYSMICLIALLGVTTFAVVNKRK